MLELNAPRRVTCRHPALKHHARQPTGIRACALRLTNTYGPGMRTCDARQTFPAGEGPLGASRQTRLRLAGPQAESVLQRHRPNLSLGLSRAQVLVPAQSAVVSQRMPAWTGSTSGQATPAPNGEPPLVLDGITICERKVPFTSASTL